MRSRTKGIKALQDELDDLTDTSRIVRRLDAALEVTGEAVRGTLPVRTGALKASTQVYSEHDANEWVGTIEVGEGIPYAVYVLNKKAPSPWDLAVNAHEPLFEDALRMEANDL